MKRQYQIALPLPPSENAAYAPDGRGAIRRTADYSKWLEEAGPYWRSQFPNGSTLLTGRLRMQRIYVFRDDRLRDISNYSKVLDDYLQGKLYLNDCQIDEEHSIRRVVKERKDHKVFVYLTEIEDLRIMDMMHPEFDPAYAS